MISKNSILDLFYTKMYTELKNDLLYKGINIGPVSSKFFIEQYINNARLIDEINQSNIEILVKKYVPSFDKIRSLRRITEFLFDIARNTYYRFTGSHIKADIYFFISNPKFIKFFDEIRLELQRNNISCAYIFWDKNDIPTNFNHKKIILKPEIPNFFQKINKSNNLLFSHVDRFRYTAKRISGTKVIIPEGCLSSMHIIGEMGKIYNFQTICIQWGFFGRSTTKVGWRDMPYDKFLVWGDFFKSQFAKYNTLDIITTGHPNLKVSNQEFEKDYILFAVQKELGDHIKNKDVVNFLKNIFNLVENMPEVKFVLRTHPDLPFEKLPLKPIKNYNNLIIHNYKDYSLNESFTAAKMCVGISSTTVIESVALNCYPVYVKSNSLPLQIHDVFSKKLNLRHVFEFEQLEQFIYNFDYNAVLNNIIELKKELFSNNSIVEELLKKD